GPRQPAQPGTPAGAGGWRAAAARARGSGPRRHARGDPGPGDNPAEPDVRQRRGLPGLLEGASGAVRSLDPRRRGVHPLRPGRRGAAAAAPGGRRGGARRRPRRTVGKAGRGRPAPAEPADAAAARAGRALRRAAAAAAAGTRRDLDRARAAVAPAGDPGREPLHDLVRARGGSRGVPGHPGGCPLTAEQIAAAGPFEMLADVVAAGRAVILSGAGLSTESGIPDYRGPTGLARRATPMTYQTFTGSAVARQRYWARSYLGWRHIARAPPNARHPAGAELSRRGPLGGVITQNVDGLHQAAGATGVTELHGSLHRVLCLSCGQRTSRAELDRRLD